MTENAPHPGPPGSQLEHARLKPFEGTYRATVKLWMGPGDPMVQHGTMINSFQLGGLYLFQDYTGDPSPGPFPAFLGKGYWGYNTTSKKYEGFWIDNASTMMQLEQGDVDASGKIWSMMSSFQHPGSGQTMSKRSVICLIDQNHNDMTTYMSGPDGNEFRSMEIAFVRA